MIIQKPCPDCGIIIDIEVLTDGLETQWKYAPFCIKCGHEFNTNDLADIGYELHLKLMDTLLLNIALPT